MVLKGDLLYLPILNWLGLGDTVKKIKIPLEFGLKKAKQSRENVPVLLKIFEDFNIPITWATVGHLFLESCNKGDHDWMEKNS